MTQQAQLGGPRARPGPLAPSGDPFLVSKLEVPPLPTSWVPRERLCARLTEGVAGPLTVVSAPAGTGKTLLAGSWVPSQAAPGPVVWLTLDQDDDAPGPFWFSLLAALRTAGVELSCGPGTPETGAGEVDRSFLSRVACSFAERDGPVVVVLDDFDTVDDGRVGDGLDFVLRRSGHALRLVLLGRRDPLLPLHRYRLRDELVEIRARDLAFTRSETERMLAAHGLNLSADGVSALLDRTEGWVVGVRLTAMAMQARGGEQDAERFVREFASDDTTIGDYLVGEVLDAQPPHVRKLLLHTSLLHHVHPSLADALTDGADAARTLGDLERSASFVSRLPLPGWYRYHELFRDVLRAQLVYEEPAVVRDLHGRAARWFADAGMLDDAVTHAAAAGEWELASSLLVDQLAVGTLLVGRPGARMRQVFVTMPAHVPGVEPAVVRAALALAACDLGGCAEALRQVDAALRRAPPRASVQLAVSLLTAVLARMNGDVLAAVAAARRARSALPASADHRELAETLASVEGSALTWLGDLDGAEWALGAGDGVGWACGDLAVVEAVRGRLRRAAQLGREAVDAFGDGDGPLALHQAGAGRLALTWVSTEEYDLPAARLADERAADAVVAGRDALLGVGHTLARARLLRLLGDYHAARTLVQAARRDTLRAGGVEASRWLERQCVLAESSLWLAEGSPERAAALLETMADGTGEYRVALARACAAMGDGDRARTTLRPLLDDRNGAKSLRVGVEAWLLEGRLQAGEGDMAGAKRAAARALRLARPERLRRPFAEEAGWLRDLFGHDQVLADAHSWLGRRLVPLPRRHDSVTSAGGPLDPGVVVPVEPLSAREHEVLALLAQMMSTEEIASALFLSHNTVKTHLKSIYRKLSASRRGEAVRRARRLGLL